MMVTTSTFCSVVKNRRQACEPSSAAAPSPATMVEGAGNPKLSSHSRRPDGRARGRIMTGAKQRHRPKRRPPYTPRRLVPQNCAVPMRGPKPRKHSPKSGQEPVIAFMIRNRGTYGIVDDAQRRRLKTACRYRACEMETLYRGRSQSAVAFRPATDRLCARRRPCSGSVCALLPSHRGTRR